MHSVLEDFTAWNVDLGAGLEYTSHYTLKDFDIIGNEDSLYTPRDYGILFGGNVSDMTIVNPTIENFTWGIASEQELSRIRICLRNFMTITVIDATFIDVDTNFGTTIRYSTPSSLRQTCPIWNRISFWINH